jgi:hypothetical protein
MVCPIQKGNIFCKDEKNNCMESKRQKFELTQVDFQNSIQNEEI